MKKTIKLAVVAALALGTTSAFATNGTELIGIGAKARSMGGVGIATSHAGENGYNNPAMISDTENMEVNVGLTYFKPSVSISAPGGISEDSTRPADILPSVGFNAKVIDDFYAGIAIYGAAGMGVEYKDIGNSGSGGAGGMSVLNFVVPLAYKISDFTIAIAPKMVRMNQQQTTYAAGTKTENLDDTQYGFGADLGVSYTNSGVTVGAVYKMGTEFDFVMNNQPFGPKDYVMKWGTPATIGLGVSYTMDEHTIAFDYKLIQNSGVAGLNGDGKATATEVNPNYNWENQNVFAIGYQYDASVWAARAGFNYGSTPFASGSVSAKEYTDTVDNYFNLPAVTTTHITLGGTYNITENHGLDLAFVYGMGEESIEAKDIPVDTKITATNDQISLTAGYNYKF